MSWCTVSVALRGLLLGGVASGCFFVEPINQRPSLEIRNESSGAVHRGDTVRLFAIWDDPDGHPVALDWRVYACTDATDPAACDDAPFQESSAEMIAIVVPRQRVSPAGPVESLRVVLEAEDALGATARPTQELVIPVINAAPSVELARTSRYRYVTGTPIQLFAKVGDIDDGPAGLHPLQWEVFAPAQLPYTLEDDPAFVGDPDDPVFAHFSKVFTPMGEGEWKIRVTATDVLGASTSEIVELAVGADGPPCLAQLSPIVPTGGAVLPLVEPALFRVPRVLDDLDVYPPQTADPILGVARFEWLVRAPGQSTYRRVEGATGNTLAFDPAAYALGDLVEIRVQIYDRSATPISCADTEQACSVISQPACIQRQTWRVEVR